MMTEKERALNNTHTVCVSTYICRISHKIIIFSFNFQVIWAVLGFSCFQLASKGTFEPPHSFTHYITEKVYNVKRVFSKTSQQIMRKIYQVKTKMFFITRDCTSTCNGGKCLPCERNSKNIHLTGCETLKKYPASSLPPSLSEFLFILSQAILGH